MIHYSVSEGGELPHGPWSPWSRPIESWRKNVATGHSVNRGPRKAWRCPLQPLPMGTERPTPCGPMKHGQVPKRGWLVATIVVGLWPAAVAGQWSILVEPQDDLVRRVAKEIGESAVECGRLLAPGSWRRPAYSLMELERPISCVRTAASEKKAAWFVLRGLTLDSWNATGLWVAADGIVQRYTYGNYAGTGSLESRACPDPSVTVSAEGFPSLACGPR